MKPSCCCVEGGEFSKSCRRALTMIHKCLPHRFHTIVRALRQDFENSPPSTQQHEGFIHGDACQPSGEPRLFLKVVEMKESLVKALLHHIFGILPVVGYPLRHGKNSPFVTKNQFLEGVRLSTLCCGHQFGVGVLVYANCPKRSHESVPPWPKRQPVRNGAIAVPDGVEKEEVLEAIGRIGDASIQGCFCNLSSPPNLSACRHSVI